MSSRLRRLEPHDVLRWLPYTTGVSAAASIALVSIKVWRLPAFPYVAEVVWLAVSAFLLSAAIGVLFGRRPIALPAWVDRGAFTSWVLAVHVGVLGLAGAVVALTNDVPEADIGGWRLPLMNKRWVVALSGLAVLTFLVLPVAVERLRRGPGVEAAGHPRTSRRRRAVPLIAGFAVVLIAAWYLAGPPWHLERHHRAIDFHEQAHLGPLQAISKGYLPYVGPASTGYAPGSQLVMYKVMAYGGRFDLVSFRTGWAVMNLAAVIIVAVVAQWWLGLGPALAVILLALTYSSAAFFHTQPDGTLGGFYGWANGLRYIAALIVVPALAGLARGGDPALRRAQGIPSSSRDERVALRSPTTVKSVLLGIVWGIGAWLAQENLSAIVMAGGLLLLLLCLTETTTWARAMWIGCGLAAGFAVVAIPVLGYYASRGQAGAFVNAYFQMPRIVTAGYGNIWWPAQDRIPDLFAYYFTLPWLIALGICALWRFPGLRLVGPLDDRRALFLAFLCVQLVCYQTVLFRTDSTHLLYTLVALPFVIVLGFIDVPRWLARGAWPRAAIRVAFVLLVVAIYPATRNVARWRDVVLMAPLAKFTTGESPSASEPPDPRVAYRRTTQLLVDDPALVPGAGLSVREFLDFAMDVHAIVGQRKTLITNLGGRVWTGLLYFMADLTPAPFPLDRETLTVNDVLREQAAEHVRAHPSEYECFIGISLTEPEARAFLETHPGSVDIQRVLPGAGASGPDTIHILLAKT